MLASRDPARVPQISRSRPKPADGEQELRVEELEERIAPRLAANHNHTVLTEG